MRRYLAAAALGAVVTAGSACGSAASEPAGADNVAACAEYHRLINERSERYGNEMGAVGQAAAVGDEDRRDIAVAVVKELFTTIADGLRAQAEVTSDGELAAALAQAADGLVDVASRIESYDDVVAADQLMSDSEFGVAGAKISEVCAR